MNPMFEELAWEQTPIGELALRRRRLSPDGDDIWEIKLNDGYLMSSQFVDGEIALADLALAMTQGENLDVVVGGLGLGYTAEAALRDTRVAKLTVVELIPQVIQWHRDYLLPLGPIVADDPRCILRRGDFFALAAGPDAFDPASPDQLHDAILIDIDHSTTHFIDEASAGFYSAQAIAAITAKLKPNGVFALWSTDAADTDFVAALMQSLVDVRVERVEFATPYRERPAFNLIYLGRKP
ncbi:polyamine aminopropyltransferase [Alteraurantiacibacter palmitatis]|uniref:Spermidine synthase n=1 Tax=Alteraurantiacibacter palmitatis TaxID=2054628 RepID=A0ABV7E2L5_9SPHN